MQERKVREERTPQDFYTGSLKPELHPVCQGNLSLTLHYFKSFTKYCRNQNRDEKANRKEKRV